MFWVYFSTFILSLYFVTLFTNNLEFKVKEPKTEQDEITKPEPVVGKKNTTPVVLKYFDKSQTLPVGSPDNPIVNLAITFQIIRDGLNQMVGLYYPENLFFPSNPKAQFISGSFGPYIVNPKDVVFWYLRKETNQTYYSTDSCHCWVEYLGVETIRYTWEDLTNDCVGGNSTPDLQFTVTFIGALK